MVFWKQDSIQLNWWQFSACCNMKIYLIFSEDSQNTVNCYQFTWTLNVLVQFELVQTEVYYYKIYQIDRSKHLLIAWSIPCSIFELRRLHSVVMVNFAVLLSLFTCVLWGSKFINIVKYLCVCKSGYYSVKLLVKYQLLSFLTLVVWLEANISLIF